MDDVTTSPALPDHTISLTLSQTLESYQDMQCRLHGDQRFSLGRL
jgi:hypothetical protein